jgi:hypothetical protein
MGSGAILLDVTGPSPKWLTEAQWDGSAFVFRAEAGKSYLLASRENVLTPNVTRPVASRLRSRSRQADYVVIGPQGFLDAASPLLALRRRQGLTVAAVSTDSIFSDYGNGESNPRAIRDFLQDAFHNWRQPSPRYVLLLGDASFDFLDAYRLGTEHNRVPPWILRTSYLWGALRRRVWL